MDLDPGAGANRNPAWSFCFFTVREIIPGGAGEGKGEGKARGGRADMEGVEEDGEEDEEEKRSRSSRRERAAAIGGGLNSAACGSQENRHGWKGSRMSR